MDNIICWADLHPGFLNAVLSATLIIVTTIYVYLTNKLVKTPYDSLLTPRIDIGPFSEQVIKVHNAGPGTAIDIHTKLMKIDYSIHTKKKGRDKLYHKCSPCVLNGPFEIKPHDEGIINLNIEFSPKWPIYLKWKTTQNKTRTSVWITRINPFYVLSPLPWYERLWLFILKWVKTFWPQTKKQEPNTDTSVN